MQPRKLRSFVVVPLCTILVYLMVGGMIDFFKDVPHDIFILGDSSEDAGSSCVLPKHDPFDSSIMRYFYNVESPCNQFPDVVFLDSEFQIQTNSSAVKETGWRHLSCEREIIKRVNEKNIAFISTSSKNSSRIHSDCSKVSCKDETSSLVYQQLLFHTDSDRVLQTKQIKDESPDSPSVVIFGIDSVSQLTAKRLLPKTLQYLKHSLGAHIFNGYTKVAENTFPNLISLLSGWKEKEEAFYRDKYLDDIVPFIWRNFSEKGYVTMYAEEQPVSPSFNAVSKGFMNPPTDHYFRPCAIAMDATKTVINSPKYKYSSTAYDKLLLLKPFMFCHGNKAKHEIHINYLKSFLSSYKNKRKFSLTWIAALAHDDLNYLRLADDQIREFFEWSSRKGHFNNTVLMFLSDHGSNLNAIRNTVIGRVEERMPFFSIALPPHLKERYPFLETNLRDNVDKLTSHFDTYNTLVDILRSSFKRQGETEAGLIGRSLFGRVPSDRTCGDAGIRREYCPCHKYDLVDLSEHELVKFGRKVVQKINSKLTPAYPQCKPLELIKVENSQKIVSNFIPVPETKYFTWYSLWHSRQRHIDSQQYRLLISTTPGLAMFESSVTLHLDGRIEVWDHISRANRYGNQSHCVHVAEVKPYCFCG
ncbi:uncharacterized protein LOC117342515 [Pecten maximus]|uniref:uncharacterized protein LOC117342515 n=1 Tax=Pecten maximus TaxID=6579 RepID=UPI001458EF4F|nr:uncharacterized protein LOC117342515 [Pecten maximus]